MTATLRWSAERHRIPRRDDDVWFTFAPEDGSDALATGFGSLELLNESRLGPGSLIPQCAHGGAEIVTYVHEGSLAYEDGRGRPGFAHAGEFRRVTAGRGFRHREMNGSRSHRCHVFHLYLRSAETGSEPRHEQQRFSAADRRGRLCVIASPDGRDGSLRMRQDTVIYSALLETGRHVVHAVAPGRCVWLHVVAGGIVIDGLVLSAGDGLGVAREDTISATALEEAEVLLVDMGDRRPAGAPPGHAPPTSRF
jgi:redox-sensitive bicupin YhaK (pirin superfamily)